MIKQEKTIDNDNDNNNDNNTHNSNNDSRYEPGMVCYSYL